LDISPSILFAGGGSGGHIAPGLAIAERVRELEPGARLHFACSTRAIDATMLREAGESFTAIDAAPPSLRPRGGLQFLRLYPRAKSQAARVLREHAISHVVALGGFIAAPVVAAASRRRIPITLVNLDNPPGRANRWIARRCDRVVSAVELPAWPGFAECVVGMPIRRKCVADKDQAACRRSLGLDPGRPVLLVTGASQGATSINRMMIALAANQPGMFDKWQVLHLSGAGEDQALREAYEHAGIAAVVLPFSHRMGLAWGAAELAISRAGANSVAEVHANAVPTVFLPYPYHKDEHQRHNAEPLEMQGGAVICRDCVDAKANVKAIGPVLRELMADGARRGAMRESLKAAAPADGALRVAELLLSGSQTMARR
jgi:UDP-N-acetylglucosamine--N-acetylmuramyl-(pentapeptide) pyrophosphoryl-undecaprenol N-acetylglucosamine transferase